MSVSDDSTTTSRSESKRRLTHILRENPSISPMKRLSQEILLQRSHSVRSVGQGDVPSKRKRMESAPIRGVGRARRERGWIG